VHATVHGMLSSLKGYEPGKEVEIRLKDRKNRPIQRNGRGTEQ
jgi:hypothetical protein